jgi:hypothetical protein
VEQSAARFFRAVYLESELVNFLLALLSFNRRGAEAQSAQNTQSFFVIAILNKNPTDCLSPPPSGASMTAKY